MKQIALAVAFGSLTFTAVAQKAQIRTANNYLADGELEKAKTAIEAAVNDESTKSSANAWYVRGLVYMKMQAKKEAGVSSTKAQVDTKVTNNNTGGTSSSSQTIEQTVNTNPGAADYYPEAGTSFKKAVALDPTYEKSNLTNNLFAVAIYNFNDGLNAFDKQDYAKSYDHFKEVGELAKLDDGKRFAGIKKMDTIARQAALYQGYSAYYANRLDEAAPLLAAAKSDPITKDANAYMMLAEIYQGKGNNTEAEATFAEAKAAFPDNKAIANAELNYYIKSGRQDQMISKLEEAVAKDPSNPDLLFTLAVAYDGLANPKDKDGKDLAKPANFSDMFSKAETAYLNAQKASPDKADITFNTGALYFNRAVMVNQDMNAITGNSAADIKKYDGLKVQRDEWFNKALPHLEKTFAGLDAKGFANLTNDDKNTYLSSIIAMKEIYAKQNKMDRVAELKAKQEATRK